MILARKKNELIFPGSKQKVPLIPKGAHRSALLTRLLTRSRGILAILTRDCTMSVDNKYVVSINGYNSAQVCVISG